MGHFILFIGGLIFQIIGLIKIFFESPISATLQPRFIFSSNFTYLPDSCFCTSWLSLLVFGRHLFFQLQECNSTSWKLHCIQSSWEHLLAYCRVPAVCCYCRWSVKKIKREMEINLKWKKKKKMLKRGSTGFTSRDYIYKLYTMQ